MSDTPDGHPAEPRQSSQPSTGQEPAGDCATRQSADSIDTGHRTRTERPNTQSENQTHSQTTNQDQPGITGPAGHHTDTVVPPENANSRGLTPNGHPLPPTKSNMSGRRTSAGHTSGLQAGPGSAHQPTSPGQRDTTDLLDEQEVAYLLGATLGVWVVGILAPMVVFLMSLMGKPRVRNSALNLIVVNALGYAVILFFLNRFRKDFDERWLITSAITGVLLAIYLLVALVWVALRRPVPSLVGWLRPRRR